MGLLMAPKLRQPPCVRQFIASLNGEPEYIARVGDYAARLSRLLGILEIGLHIEELSGADKSLYMVVDIFNKVNSGGTKLSKGDMALAKIYAEWPDARDRMKENIKEWEANGYRFNLDWQLRSVNTLLTGEAKFQYLHDRSAEEIENGLARVAGLGAFQKFSRPERSR